MMSTIHAGALSWAPESSVLGKNTVYSNDINAVLVDMQFQGTMQNNT